MDMQLRPMTPQERSYSYTQCTDIIARTGCIGYLRADMDSTGTGFFSSWNDFRQDLKTDEFKKEFDDVINSMRENEEYGGILKTRTDLFRYCYSHPDSAFDEFVPREFGFRADTQNYTYMLRLNPNRGEYNAYIYCYLRDRLQQHMENASRGIRFVDTSYKDLFRLPDGEKVRIRSKDGQTQERTCRYLDEYHMECGSSVFHICEFAERMEQAGNKVEPVNPIFPDFCYSILPSSGQIIKIQKGESGYYPTNTEWMNDTAKREYVDHVNDKLGVSKAQEAAMLAGSMFGWDVPAADPRSYDQDGNPVALGQRKASLEAQISQAQNRTAQPAQEDSRPDKER